MAVIFVSLCELKRISASTHLIFHPVPNLINVSLVLLREPKKRPVRRNKDGSVYNIGSIDKVRHHAYKNQ